MWKVETSLRSIEIEEISARNEFSYVTVLGMFDESIRYVVDYPKKKANSFPISVSRYASKSETREDPYPLGTCVARMTTAKTQ